MKIDRKTHNIDATGRILGRLAVEVADLIRGKGKVSFVPYIDNGDIVNITNIDKIKVTGNKLEDKMYHRHSGYIGGLKTTSLKKMMSEKPQDVLKIAVYGMLPKNRTRDVTIKRLNIS